MINKQALFEDLTAAFMNYQYRLDHPMPSSNETKAAILLRYRNDYMFRNKVDSLTSGVMGIVDKHITE